jgi:hypothetical protein
VEQDRHGKAEPRSPRTKKAHAEKPVAASSQTAAPREYSLLGGAKNGGITFSDTFVDPTTGTSHGPTNSSSYMPPSSAAPNAPTLSALPSTNGSSVANSGADDSNQELLKSVTQELNQTQLGQTILGYLNETDRALVVVPGSTSEYVAGSNVVSIGKDQPFQSILASVVHDGTHVMEDDQNRLDPYNSNRTQFIEQAIDMEAEAFEAEIVNSLQRYNQNLSTADSVPFFNKYMQAYNQGIQSYIGMHPNATSDAPEAIDAGKLHAENILKELVADREVGFNGTHPVDYEQFYGMQWDEANSK